MNEEIIHIICPNCGDFIEIEQVNCAIFRHGVFKDTLEQIDPHAPKELCDELVSRNFIFGCGKPFKLVIDVVDNRVIYKAVKCDYI